MHGVCMRFISLWCHLLVVQLKGGACKLKGSLILCPCQMQCSRSSEMVRTRYGERICTAKVFCTTVSCGICRPQASKRATLRCH